MNIPPITPENVSHVPKARTKQAKTDFHHGTPLQDSVQTDGTDKLLTTLLGESETRTDVVERAKVLATDPNYPPADVVNKLAKLFVKE